MELLIIILSLFYHVIIIINIKLFSLSVTRDPMIFLPKNIRTSLLHRKDIKFNSKTATFFPAVLCIIFICGATFLLSNRVKNDPAITFRVYLLGNKPSKTVCKRKI